MIQKIFNWVTNYLHHNEAFTKDVSPRLNVYVWNFSRVTVPSCARGLGIGNRVVNVF
jgi:hypothetical protein